MDITIYYNNGNVREFTNINLVYDNLHTKTFDLHYRLEGAVLEEDRERMCAIDKTNVARIHIKGGNDDKSMEKLRI